MKPRLITREELDLGEVLSEERRKFNTLSSVILWRRWRVEHTDALLATARAYLDAVDRGEIEAPQKASDKHG